MRCMEVYQEGVCGKKAAFYEDKMVEALSCGRCLGKAGEASEGIREGEVSDGPPTDVKGSTCVLQLPLSPVCVFHGVLTDALHGCSCFVGRSYRLHRTDPPSIRL